MELLARTKSTTTTAPVSLDTMEKIVRTTLTTALLIHVRMVVLALMVSMRTHAAVPMGGRARIAKPTSMSATKQQQITVRQTLSVRIQLEVSHVHAKVVSVEMEKPAQILTSALKMQADATATPSAPIPKDLVRASASLDLKEMV